MITGRSCLHSRHGSTSSTSDSQTVANRDSAVGHRDRGESAADDGAEATTHAARDRLNDNGCNHVGGRPARRSILPARVRDRRLHRVVLLAVALRRGDDRGGGGPHDESLRRTPRSEIRWFFGVFQAQPVFETTATFRRSHAPLRVCRTDAPLERQTSLASRQKVPLE